LHHSVVNRSRGAFHDVMVAPAIRRGKGPHDPTASPAMGVDTPGDLETSGFHENIARSASRPEGKARIVRVCGPYPACIPDFP
jgi:hypothetical protein